MGPSPRARGARSAASARGRHGDHPRVRGEHPVVPASSSRRHGTIPACAGSTARLLAASRERGDHPRVRGEHRVAARFARKRRDHPRVRGEHVAAGRPTRSSGGTIPACAGSTTSADGTTGPPSGPSPRARGARPADLGYRRRRDHPRVRGEHASAPEVRRRAGPSPRARGARPARPWSRRSAGPSPRARGARARRDSPLGQRGTIPACAGSTTGTSAPCDAAAGTIPACAGSTDRCGQSAHAARGPSPRARGARRSLRWHRVDGRDHPRVRGEQRRPCSCAADAGRDHPRVRGEHDVATPGDAALAGPSPRARGARRQRRELGWPRDHPRVRGEHAPDVGAGGRRGTIPACAGSTLADLRVCRWRSLFWSTFVRFRHLAQGPLASACRSGGVWRPCSSL